MIYFDPTNEKLFYVKAEFTVSTVWAIELFQNIDYIRETVFVGTNVGTVNSYNYIK